MSVQDEVVAVLNEVLGLDTRRAMLNATSPLLGAIPELDSMAVVSILTSFEDRFGFAVADDDLDGSTFATVGSLVAFVESKLGV